MESSVTVPITFWNNSKPTFRVSSIRITPSGNLLVTSSLDGELSIWDLNVKEKAVKPRNLLIGHTDPVTCLECTDEYAISTSEGGEICRWNLRDGHCSKSVKSVFVHRSIQLFKWTRLEDEVLFTCGDYHEIFIIHSAVLQTILVLHSKTESDWISCFHVMSSLEIGHDVVSAVNKSGYIKLWILEELSDSSSYETQSTLLPVTNVSHIKCSVTQTQILVVCDRSWTVFDAKYLKTICSQSRICNEKFLGGDFCDSDVLIWTNESRFYLFKLGAKTADLKVVFSSAIEMANIFEPAMCFHNTKHEKFLVQCDVSGKMAFWRAVGKNTSDKPWFTCDLGCMLGDVQCKVFEKYTREVTCCVVISELDLFVVGCSDGTIITVPALETLLSSYSKSQARDSGHKTLIGHKGRINCLLYPHDKYPYHNRSYLLSGGSDFSVCLWDIFSHKLIYRFCVQSGEIIKLLIPPEECKHRVRNSICSVASDHSVAILNLKELKCIVLASRQLFPVVTINWRPLDDFIIIECFDGTVYIWEMETGHLDRVLHGVTAQEVIYACKESNHEDASNFCLREDALVGKDHFRRGLYQIEKDLHAVTKSHAVTVRGFLDAFHSENQIVSFSVERILADSYGGEKANAVDPEMYHRMQALTQAPATSPTVTSVGAKTTPASSEKAKDLAGFLQSILRDRKGDARSSPHYCILSESQNVSVFLSAAATTPKLETLNEVALAALTHASESRDKGLDLKKLHVDLETLARLWQNRNPTIRKIARKVFLAKIQSQSVRDRSSILQRWFKYLPHFATVDGVRLTKSDHEVADMQAVALVLFGVIGSDLKFKIDDPAKEDAYTQETSQAILHLLQSPQHGELQTIAMDLLGRGYAVWEQHLKFDKVIHLLFEMTYDYDKYSRGEFTPGLDRCLTAHEALLSVAIARTEAFAACITKEIAHIRNSQTPKTDATFADKSKTEMILILTELLERTPYIMLQHLNDVITILTYCISPSHLKQETIGKLIPVLDRFKQVHHSVPTQRIAVGLQDGFVVIHELKTFKCHKVAAHGDTVSAVMFSPDGKLLATYCFFENRLYFWHVFASIFGLGHVHIKCIKTFETSPIEDKNVRNHLEIGELSWPDNKSVRLHLCDGTQSVFYV